MNAADVLTLPWHNYYSWEGIQYDKLTATDIDSYLTKTFQDIARQLSIPYAELLPILQKENEGFFTFKNNFFEKHTSIYYSGVDGGALRKLLMLPDIKAINKVKNRSDKVLALYYRLSEKEKIEFLQKIGVINIKIKHSAVKVEIVE